MRENKLKIRLKEFCELKQISLSEFGRKIGVSNAYVASVKENISLEKLEKIHATFRDLNIEWLLFGEGAMLLKVDKIRELEKENEILKRENVLLSKLCAQYEHNKNA